jgi:DmsE family decaheme c-type cytochrome
VVVVLLLLGAAAQAAEPADYVEGGAQVCTTCHDKPAILSILKTPHAVKGDRRTPFGQSHACETCHGPGADHVAKQTPMPMRFGPDAPVREQNAVCLTCHQGGERIHWSGSTHEQHDVGCTSCHKLHEAESALLAKDIRPETFVKDTQSRVCFACHPEVRAETYLRSAHPLKEGLIDCSDCHAVHGSTTENLLAQETLNETCYECHAEKRGPFLWEHQPARESCANCHVPHGSNHPPLLEARGPWLCQQCHLAQFHPSGAYGGEGLAGGGAPNRNLLVKNCRNCHPEVHGSNHPSGVRFTR